MYTGLIVCKKNSIFLLARVSFLISLSILVPTTFVTSEECISRASEFISEIEVASSICLLAVMLDFSAIAFRIGNRAVPTIRRTANEKIVTIGSTIKAIIISAKRLIAENSA